MTIEDRLSEREKELACIYSICLLAADASEPNVVAEGVARALQAAMQREDMVSCFVYFKNRLDGREVRISRCAKMGIQNGKSRPQLNKVPSIEAFLPEDMTAGPWQGSIRLEYFDYSLEFLPQENALLRSVLIVAASMLRTSSLIENLKTTSSNLASKNTALREVLSVIEDERRNSLRNFRERLASDILPLAERVKDPLLTTEKRRAYLDLLIDELGRDIASFGSDSTTHASLSPREREIAVQVRNGRTSKEIAELLGIAEATIERHRHNIRKKLKISNQKVNLAGLLSNDDTSKI